MQVSVETTSGLERRMKIGVPADLIENEVDSRLKKAAPTIRIDGFRKGKVPMKVIRQRYGKGIRQEVLGEMINKSFYQAISQENIKPAGQPSIEPVNDKVGEDFEFVATFEVYPNIDLVDLASISVEKPVAEITEADLEKMLDVLRKQQADWTVVDRAAEEGDQVDIDYRGTRNGEVFAGGEAEGAKLVLGSGQMITGFEDAIVGMSAGDSKTVPLKFPDDYRAEELRGAEVEFAIAVNSVSEQVLPELNADYYARFGIEDGDHDKFVAEVRANMERELRNAIQSKLKNRIMEQLFEKHQVEVPKALVASETQALRQQMVQQFGGGAQIDAKMLPDELFAQQAEKRAAIGLIVSSMIEQAGLKADADQLRAHIEDLASTYEQPQEVVQYYYSNKELLQSAESAVLEDQVVGHILANANVTEKPCTYEQALTPDKKSETAA